jgi:zinc protease
LVLGDTSASSVNHPGLLLFIEHLPKRKPVYLLQRQQIVKNMTVDKIRALSAKYLDINKMVWLVVGDAKTQLEPLKKLGFGDPVMLAPATKGF